MARGVNKVILVGNLGKDPETRYTANGMAICTFSLATSESWKDKQTGESQERTEWHRVKIFGKLGEIAGKQVYIEGAIRSDKYTDKDGVERYSFDVVAEEMQMLGGREGEGGGGSSERGERGGGERPERSSAPSRAAPRSQPSSGGGRPEPRREAPPADDFEDDIPF